MFRQFLAVIICVLCFGFMSAEVAEFYSPTTSSSLKNMKQGAVTVAITQGEGAKKPTADADGMGNIEFYPKNVLSVTVAEGYYLKAITIGTSQSTIMEPYELSSGELAGTPDMVWTPDEGQAVTSMTLVNGNEDPLGKNRKYTSISVIMVEYEVPTAEMMTPEIAPEDITALDNGGYQVTISLLNARHELYYKVTQISRNDDGDVHVGFTPADGNGKERVITLPSGNGFLTYYAYDPTTEIKGVERTVRFGNGESSIGKIFYNESASGVIFDLQGRRVLTPGRGAVYVKNGRKTVVK